MHCRNCGNEVNEKAVGCPKCGMNPNSEKNFCPGCGVETKENQVMCVKCGVSLTGKTATSNAISLPKIDTQNLLKNKSMLIAIVALIGCMMPWINISAPDNFINLNISINYSMFGLGDPVFMMADTILNSSVIYLFPLCLIGIIIADFVPQLVPFKKYLTIASLVLIVYAAIGLYQITNPSNAPSNDFAYGMSQMRDMYSIGWGFYLAFIATVASAFFSGLIPGQKKADN